MTINNAAQRRYIERLKAENIMTVHRPRFDLDGHQRNYFASGSLGDRIGSRYFERTYRTLEILEMDGGNGLPQMIDHHAGNAWFRLWSFAAQGYGPDFTANDKLKSVCEIVMGLPESLRDRLDAVLEGLRIEIDPDGAFESEFVSWSRDWYKTMTLIFTATPGQYKKRLTMMQQAAAEAFPAIVVWFERIRHEICDGGHTSAWAMGDEKRTHVTG